MNPAQRTELLKKWIKPSSENEQNQQQRAEAMVRKAIAASAAFGDSQIAIYTKGSYPNNTNVRQDSDVDVVVELQDCVYYDYKPGITPTVPTGAGYQGPWTPTSWRRAVGDALIAHFGAAGVDRTGTIAINVSAVTGSRPSADVVPSFDYRRYNDPHKNVWDEGSCVWPSNGSAKVVNWPAQQLANGRKHNTASGSRYKNYVRALKNAENVLAKAGTINELPSYFMECLVFNVPAGTLKTGDLDQGFRATLVNLWEQLEAEQDTRAMVEPNWMKWLFTGDKKWKLQDGKDLILATWHHFGYGS
jgi:hypothetical protein